MTKRKEICEMCNKIKPYFDERVPYGVKNPGSDYPEPNDPLYTCKECSKKAEKIWSKDFNKGHRFGDYEKSVAERKAAKKFGLIWVGSSGIGMMGCEDFEGSHKYISVSRYNFLRQLPYWGYCSKCGKKEIRRKLC